MRQTESDAVPSTANPASAVAILDVLRREHWPEVARIYVDASARGLGLGRLLLEALITSTEAARIWTIQTGIFPSSPVRYRTPGVALQRRDPPTGRDLSPPPNAMSLCRMGLP